MAGLTYPLINGNYSSSNSVILKVAGLQFVGCKSMNYKDELKVTDIMGFHPRKLGRTVGVESASGDIEMFLPEAMALQDTLAQLASQQFGGSGGWKQVAFDIFPSYGELGQTVYVDHVLGCRVEGVEAGISNNGEPITRKFTLSVMLIKWNGKESLAFPQQGATNL